LAAIVDPVPDPKLVEARRPNTSFAIAASDAFFERTENRVWAQGSKQALVDGDYSLVKALRDFENLEALAAPNSIIAIHDVVPMTWTRDGNVEGGDSVPYRRHGAVSLLANGIVCAEFLAHSIGIAAAVVRFVPPVLLRVS